MLSFGLSFRLSFEHPTTLTQVWWPLDNCGYSLCTQPYQPTWDQLAKWPLTSDNTTSRPWQFNVYGSLFPHHLNGNFVDGVMKHQLSLNWIGPIYTGVHFFHFPIIYRAHTTDNTSTKRSMTFRHPRRIPVHRYTHLQDSMMSKSHLRYIRKRSGFFRTGLWPQFHVKSLPELQPKDG